MLPGLTIMSIDDVLGPEVLSLCLEFLSVEEVCDAKQYSRVCRTAARKALTRGRWKSLRFVCQQALEVLGQGVWGLGGWNFNAAGLTLKQTLSNSAFSTSALFEFREAWATEPGRFMVEIASWPGMAGSRVGIMTWLSAVAPSFCGFSRIVAAFVNALDLEGKLEILLPGKDASWWLDLLRAWCSHFDVGFRAMGDSGFTDHPYFSGHDLFETVDIGDILHDMHRDGYLLALVCRELRHWSDPELAADFMHAAFFQRKAPSYYGTDERAWNAYVQSVHLYLTASWHDRDRARSFIGYIESRRPAA